MNSKKLNDWLQVVGLFAVVLSLLFVGMQMRQDLVIADATLYQMRANSAMSISVMMIENEEARIASRKLIREGLDTLTDDERALFLFAFQSILNHYESSHYLYLQGLLSQEQWDSDIRQLHNLWRDSDVAKFWTGPIRESYRESFAMEVDRIFN